MIYADHGLSRGALCTSNSIGTPSDAIESRRDSTRLDSTRIVLRLVRAGLKRHFTRRGRLPRPWRLTSGLSTNALKRLAKLV